MRAQVQALAVRGTTRFLLPALVVFGLVLSTSTAAFAARVTRFSGNECGYIAINYTYQSQGSGRYWIEVEYGGFGWQGQTATCGPLGLPYGMVLQWTGSHNADVFGWRAFPDGYIDGDGGPINPFSGGGYANIRFRVCNWNTNTGWVGTCGAS